LALFFLFPFLKRRIIYIQTSPPLFFFILLSINVVIEEDVHPFPLPFLRRAFSGLSPSILEVQAGDGIGRISLSFFSFSLFPAWPEFHSPEGISVSSPSPPQGIVKDVLAQREAPLLSFSPSSTRPPLFFFSSCRQLSSREFKVTIALFPPSRHGDWL